MLGNVSSPNNSAMLMNGTIGSYCNIGQRRPIVCVLLGLLKYSYVVVFILLSETGTGASDSGMNYVLATRFTTIL